MPFFVCFREDQDDEGVSEPPTKRRHLEEVELGKTTPTTIDNGGEPLEDYTKMGMLPPAPEPLKVRNVGVGTSHCLQHTIVTLTVSLVCTPTQDTPALLLACNIQSLRVAYRLGI